MSKQTPIVSKTLVAVFLVIWLALLAVGRERMLRDPGTLWHTVVGERIVESGSLPQTDSFTWSNGGEPWIAQQWLGEYLMALVHRIAGIDGLLICAVTLLAVIFAAIAGRLARAGMPPPLATVVVMLVIAASSYHFLARPHLATIACMLLTFGLLSDIDAGRRNPRWLLVLPPLFVIWSNLHGGVLGGIATTWLILFGWMFARPILARLRGSSIAPPDGPQGAGPLLIGLVASLSVLAVLVNPYGVSLPRVWISLMGSDVLPRLIVEHAPLKLLTVEGAMISALFVVYLFVLIRAWRSGPRITWFIPMVWFLLALSRVRHGPLFAMTAAVAVADMWDCARRMRTDTSFSLRPPLLHAAPRFAVVPIAALCLGLSLQHFNVRLPLVGSDWARLSPRYWPTTAVDVLNQDLARRSDRAGRSDQAGARASRRTGDAPRLFNDMLFGGYLIYAAPKVRPFIDDRCELHRDHGLLRYAGIQKDPVLINGLAAMDDVRYALVRTGLPLQQYLATSPYWRQLHTDNTASLYRASETRLHQFSARTRQPR